MLNRVKNVEHSRTASEKSKRGLGKTETPSCESAQKAKANRTEVSHYNEKTVAEVIIRQNFRFQICGSSDRA